MGKSNFAVWILVLVVLLVAILFVADRYSPGLGSVGVGNEYYATTTPSGTDTWTDQLIRQGWGTLGSVIITDTGSTAFNLYNATSVRAISPDNGGTGSSTLQLARISSDLAAGTYIFDVVYTKGLFLDYIGGTTGTSTITYR